MMRMACLETYTLSRSLNQAANLSFTLLCVMCNDKLANTLYAWIKRESSALFFMQVYRSYNIIQYNKYICIFK